MSTTKPVALITGASSGIGWSLAKVFARKNYDLVVVARRENRLKNLRLHCRTQKYTALRWTYPKPKARINYLPQPKSSVFTSTLS